MMDERRARELARAAFEDDVVLGGTRELNEGWFFPCLSSEHPRSIVSVVVNKGTGRVLRVLIGSSLEKDPSLYDRGHQHERYDLVVLAIADDDAAVRSITAMHFGVHDPYYRHGRVWRIGRALTEADIRQRLSALPAIFTGRIAFGLEELENAREQGWFTFRTFEYRGNG